MKNSRSNANKRGIAVCKKCGSRYQPKTLESATVCSYCRGDVQRFRVCLHNVPLTEACAVCISLNGSTGVRALSAATKTGKMLKVSREQLQKPAEKGYAYYLQKLQKASNDS